MKLAKHRCTDGCVPQKSSYFSLLSYFKNPFFIIELIV